MIDIHDSGRLEWLDMHNALLGNSLNNELPVKLDWNDSKFEMHSTTGKNLREVIDLAMKEYQKILLEK